MANSRITLFLIIIKFNFVITEQPGMRYGIAKNIYIQTGQRQHSERCFSNIYSQIIRKQGKNSCKYKKTFINIIILYIKFSKTACNLVQTARVFLHSCNIRYGLTRVTQAAKDMQADSRTNLTKHTQKEKIILQIKTQKKKRWIPFFIWSPTF